MYNKYIIALNHKLVKDEQMVPRKAQKSESQISSEELGIMMNYVRKYPRTRIQRQKLFTCGFSKN